MSLGVVEEGLCLEEQVGEADALVSENEVCRTGTWDLAETDDAQPLQLVDLRRDMDAAGDVPIDVGLHAHRMVADIQQDVQGVRGLEKRSKHCSSGHVHPYNP